MSNTLKKKKGYKIAKSTEKTFYQKQEILKEHNKPTLAFESKRIHCDDART